MLSESGKCHASCLQEVDYIEYFAGFGRINDTMKSARYRSVRFDIKDHNPKPGTKRAKKTNFMDLNSASGYAFLWR